MTNKQLYAEVKAGFIAKQSSLRQFCIKNKILRQNARKALLGEWKGKKGTALRDFLIKESGIQVRTFNDIGAN